MLLHTIRDADLGYDHTFPAIYKTRVASRAFLSDADGNLALMHNGLKDFYKLPGGGVMEGESPEQALHRELLEETGCASMALIYLGYLEEYRGGLDGFKQTSHLFRAQVAGPKGSPAFDEGELAEGFSLLWLPPEEVTYLLTNQQPGGEYGRKFMVAREKALISFL